MPQQSLLPEHPAMTSLAITIKSFPHTKYADEVQVSTAIGRGGKDPQTYAVTLLRGVECDFLNTLVEEITSTYMYGERPKDVMRAAADVARLARAHGVAHQF